MWVGCARQAPGRIAQRAGQQFAELETGTEQSHLGVGLAQTQRISGFLDREPLDIPQKEVTKKMRREAKNLCFAYMYSPIADAKEARRRCIEILQSKLKPEPAEIPPGEVISVKVVSTEVRKHPVDHSPYIEIEYQVEGGEFAGEKLFTKIPCFIIDESEEEEDE